MRFLPIMLLMFISFSFSQSLDSLLIISNKAKIELKSPGFLFKKQTEVPKFELKSLPRLPMAPFHLPQIQYHVANECIRFHEYDANKLEVNARITEQDTSIEKIRAILANLQEQSTNHGKNLEGIGNLLEGLAAFITAVVAALTTFKHRRKLLSLVNIKNRD